MTITSCRSTEPLYIVFVKDPKAEQQLKSWAQRAQVQVTVDGSRMKIFDARAYYLFQMHWTHNPNNVIIWDCWHRRHIYLA